MKLDFDMDNIRHTQFGVGRDSPADRASTLWP